MAAAAVVVAASSQIVRQQAGPGKHFVEAKEGIKSVAIVKSKYFVGFIREKNVFRRYRQDIVANKAHSERSGPPISAIVVATQERVFNSGNTVL